MNIIQKNIKDILDTKGINNNFLNDKPYSSEYKKLAEKWKQLPMYMDYKIVENFFNLLNEKQVILIISGTGSGKTVLVPKFFLKYIITLGIPGKIGITNPKIITTKYNAEYGAKTLDVKLGEEIGYKFSGSSSDSLSDKSRLLYITDGLIVAIILGGDTLLKDYIGIIIDEAHERHTNIDILLRMIKNILFVRPEFKLIIMSATINEKIFRDYFKDKDIKYGQLEVGTKPNFSIKQYWSDENINNKNYLDFAIKQCFKILNESTIGDILIFVPTSKDTLKGCGLIKKECPQIIKSICDKLFCVEVYSKMIPEDKDLAVDKDLYKKKGFTRKIIFSTNVAESSITFDGLVYVIDTGLEITNYYDNELNGTIVGTIYTSQAQIKQRIGRAGRTQPGIAYHLYSKENFDKFKPYPDPDILKSDIIEFMLSFIKTTKTVKNTLTLINGMISIPSDDQIISSLYRLYFMKAIKFVNSDNIDWKNIKTYNGALTAVGIGLLRIRSIPIISRLAIIMSKYMNCQTEMIEIMALTEEKLERFFHYDKKKDSRKVQNYFSKYSVQNSDHLTIYNIYNQLYKKNRLLYLERKEFSKINKTIEDLTRDSERISDNLYEDMNSKYKLILIKPFNNLYDNIRYVLFRSHYINLLIHDKKNKYTTLHFYNNLTANIEYLQITRNEKSKYVICSNLTTAFGNKSFHGITDISKFL